MLKELPLFGKEHEDAYEHIEWVVDISSYYNSLNESNDAVMLWLLLVTLKGEGKDGLKSLLFDTITTWADFRSEFVHQFTPPSKVAKLKRNIQNFK